MNQDLLERLVYREYKEIIMSTPIQPGGYVPPGEDGHGMPRSVVAAVRVLGRLFGGELSALAVADEDPPDHDEG